MIPVVLFAYARPEHLGRTLACLRENQVPRIYAFSDGPRSAEIAPRVATVRRMLRAIDWCEVILQERETNLGLGRSIRSGVSVVLQQHEACLVVEDDLICVPGTYHYLQAALAAYRDEPRVMSVTGWTHPRIIPPGTGEQPYFDGRAECLLWGTWRHAWVGMQDDAQTLLQRCRAAGIDPYSYGTDLPNMARVELKQNIWAVRWLYWHILNHGLCLRPPWSMVDHIGFDTLATNAAAATWLAQPPLRAAPPIPTVWPEPVEALACRQLHQQFAVAHLSLLRRLYQFVRRRSGR